ncbi:MAG: ATP-binding protein [Muribaculaceae bacterium]|nr:ATP-binding protein [Muribaculaceae bacterium]
MIQEFRVKNCLSVRDEQVLNFVASSDDTAEDYLVVSKGNVRLLKVGLIYGANASGKSNMLLALGWLIRFMGGWFDPRRTDVMQAPFLLNEESRLQPTEMGLVFYIGDVRYEYSMVIKENTVLKEVLNRYPLGRPAMVYSRSWNEDTESSEITFGSTLKLTAKQKNTLTGVTLPHTSVIAAYINNNIERNEVFDELKKYLRRQILPVATANSKLEKFCNGLMKMIPSLKEFVIKVLSQADFNISDLTIEEQKTELPEEVWKELQSLSDYIENPPDRTLTEDMLFFEHSVLNFKQQLPIDLESAGTNRMYGLAAILYLLLHSGAVMLSDEIETSLHYDLVRYFIMLFLLNSDDSQLICTTHSLLLLDEPFVRRDCIHICRKDSAGATEVVRASEFGLRKDVSILTAYREGKLGGIPNLGGMIL